MKRCGKLKYAIVIELVLLTLLFAVRQAGKPSAPVTSGSIIVEEPEEEAGEETEKDYIKWVDFNVSYEPSVRLMMRMWKPTVRISI